MKQRAGSRPCRNSKAFRSSSSPPTRCPATRAKPATPAATPTSPSPTVRGLCWRRSASTCLNNFPQRSPLVMHSPPRILIVDDNETNRDILMARLGPQGYELKQAADGEEALAAVRALLPDLILLDIMMPKIDGIEVCKQLKGDASLPFMPIILCTAKADSKDVVAGLEAGADEYLTKPIDQMALVARVKAALRLKQLHDQVTEMNRNLEQRVIDQLGEIERMSGLKRFLAPQIAELVMSAGGEKLLDSHRKDVTIVFCDLRGFTAFAETAEPEEVMTVLREYHDGLAGIINAFEGTLERFAGDGLMVLFNDPMPCPDPCERGVKMAVQMRDQ